jgi:two-component sensor histidine kinase
MSIKKPVILCVDDEQIILNSLNRQLTRRFGNQFDLEFCESAEEALELINALIIERHTVVMVISDQIMPGMSGDEFLIKVHEKYPKIVKVLLTGQAAIESAMNAVNNADLYRYLTKPWNEHDLILTVEKGLQQYYLKSDKTALLAEVHHRVKNNLAIVSGLLQLQSNSLDQEQAKEYLNQSVGRISSIAKVHELIYESDTFSSIPLKKYIENLVPTIINSMTTHSQKVELKMEIEEYTMNMNQVVYVGLLLNELITNTLKHAFSHNQGGLIEVAMYEKNSRIYFSYSDNGPGLESEDIFHTSKSLGLTLVRTQLKQLKAEYDLKCEQGFKLDFNFQTYVGGAHGYELEESNSTSVFH